MNRWGITVAVQERVRVRDKKCVYCRAAFKRHVRGRGGRVRIATWEHIDNDGDCSDRNVALCCCACNSSKGTKALAEWLESEYCKARRISARRVALVVARWLKRRTARRGALHV
jgi:hypothetical protein